MSKENQIDISVIIPVYNVEEYLHDCLDSVVTQKGTSFEVICIDDGSTDGSLDVLKKYQKEHGIMRILSKENGGLSSARNYGIEHSKGRYLYCLDSDDLLEDENCLQFMVDMMDANVLDILYFDGSTLFESEQMRKEHGVFDGYFSRKKSYGSYEKGSNFFADLVENEDWFVNANLQCLRASFIKKNDLKFPEGMIYEDNLFKFQSLLMAERVCHVNRKIYIHRVRENSIMTSPAKFTNFYSAWCIYREMVEFWKTHEQILDIGVQISMVIDRMDRFTYMLYVGLAEQEKDKKSMLSVFDAYELDRWLERHMKWRNEEYLIPYHLLRSGQRVVLYGAGKVGRSFFRQAKQDDYIQIVGIIDRNWKKFQEIGLSVEPPASIDSLNYDAILIAIENEETAKTIDADLQTAGIPAKKIKWDGHAYRKKRNHEYAYRIKSFLEDQFAHDKTKLFVFNLPEHGNMGDYAIGYAQEQFFNDYFPEYQFVSVTIEQWIALKHYFKRNVKKNDLIMITGGGNFGDLWRSGKTGREVIETFPENKKVYLPNNLTYRNSRWELNPQIKKDLKWIASQANTYFLFREQNSYCFAKEIVSDCACVPDMALYLHVPRKERFGNGRILLCLRDDSEKIFTQKLRLVEILKENGYSYDSFDIHLQRYVSQAEGREVLQNVIRRIQQYSIVITDRLHGMVLSAISETPCIALDNMTAKVSGVYEWIKNIQYITFLDSEAIEDVEDLIQKLMGIQEPCYVVPVTEFDRMARILKEKVFQEGV